MKPAPTKPASDADRIIWWIIIGLTLLVVALVILLRWVPRPDVLPPWAGRLPALNALLNTTCSILLASSWVAIRRGRAQLHQRLNLAAFVLSSLFLASYVTFHALVAPTRFPADNPLRPLYLGILLSHTLLAVVVLPMVLMSFWLALRGRLAGHRRLARWTMPVWLYVTVTGVVVYLMISPHYPF